MKLITIPASEPTLILEDDIGRRHWFISRYRLPHAFLASTPDQAIRLIRELEPTVFLDYDLAPGITSESVARFLAESDYAGQVYIHSQNDFGRQVLKRILPTATVVPYGEFEIQTTQATANV
jgi:Cyclic-phosphate processing Receiver domain